MSHLQRFAILLRHLRKGDIYDLGREFRGVNRFRRVGLERIGYFNQAKLVGPSVSGS